METGHGTFHAVFTQIASLAQAVAQADGFFFLIQILKGTVVVDLQGYEPDRVRAHVDDR